MLYPTTPDDLRRRRLIVVGIATALLLIAFITYAVLVDRGHSSDTAPTDPTQGTVDPTPVETEPVVTELPGSASDVRPGDLRP